MTRENPYRKRLQEYIVAEARPIDKYGHQPRLYQLALQVGAGLDYDDEVVYAAVWLHDLGVFIGHRPEDPAQLERWDHVAYVEGKAPDLLREFGFPAEKVAAVVEVIRTHQPKDEPASIEAVIVRDADILEQLGAIAILRQSCKVGRDTRFPTFTPAVAALRRALKTLPGKLKLETSRALAQPRIRMLEQFLAAVEHESQGELN